MKLVCRECGEEIKVLGSGMFGDSMIVECQSPTCGETYEIDPEDAAELEWVGDEIEEECDGQYN